MKDLRQVVRRPLITEKGTLAKEASNHVVFEVDRRANKIEIRNAVEDLFKVKVLQVRTLNCEGKEKRMGKIIGKRSDWKKAYVTLAPGQTVEFFEGA